MYREHSLHKPRVRAGAQSRDSAESRFRIAKAGFLAFGFLLIIRLFILQVVDVDIYRALASEQRDIYKDLFPERGEILIQDNKDFGQIPLATNKDLFVVYADTRLIENPKITADKLAPFLFSEDARSTECSQEHLVLCGGDECSQEHSVLCGGDDYQQLLTRLSKQDDPYEPLKHGVESAVVDEIKKLELAGIDANREATRFYPLGNIGSHIAGFVGSDGDKRMGRYGIEGALDEELAGIPGFFQGERDVGGRWIPVGNRKLQSAVDGSDVVLTIDRAIEHMACARLSAMVKEYSASGGTVIIMEVKTGAILAMCGAPDYDPNVYSEVEDLGIFSNLATIGQYEPGSVFKVITMAAAIDAGAVSPETTYEDTGAVKIGNYIIRNSDLKTYGIQTMTEVLDKSLNTGAIFAAHKAGRDVFGDYVKRFGFGEKTGIEIKQEAAGDVSSLSQSRDIYLATNSFGQGISVTPIQLVQAFGAIANNGVMMKPYMVQEIRKDNGAIIVTEPKVIREVISARTAVLLSGMMTSVVEGAHGKRASVPGYYVAGKTGTAQIANQNKKGYEEGTHIGTFVGFAPVENPKFVMLTRLDRPKGVRFAESTAAPLFGEIAKFLLQYFEIKPTRPVN